MFLIPQGTNATDTMIPDFLVSEAMIDRYLAVRPPQFRIGGEFDAILNEIERAYVLGRLFAAIASSVVTIERMLNEARIKLYPFGNPPVPALKGKGRLDQLASQHRRASSWSFLENEIAEELRKLYKTRCEYLHSAPLGSLERDARRVDAAFALLKVFVGFPESLFAIGNQMRCLDESHPVFKVFYAPTIAQGLPPTGRGSDT